MSKKTKYGWILGTDENPSCVYLDTEGNEVYLTAVSNSDTKNPFPDEALCIGEVTTFIRNEDTREMFEEDFPTGLSRSVAKCIRESGMNPRHLFIVCPDTGQTEHQLMASAVAGFVGAKKKIGLICAIGPDSDLGPRTAADMSMSMRREMKEELSTVSIRPLFKTRKDAHRGLLFINMDGIGMSHDEFEDRMVRPMSRDELFSKAFPTDVDFESLKLPKEFLEPPVVIDSYGGSLEKTQEEPELPDGQGSVAPTKGRKRRFPRPR